MVTVIILNEDTESMYVITLLLAFSELPRGASMSMHISEATKKSSSEQARSTWDTHLASQKWYIDSLCLGRKESLFNTTTTVIDGLREGAVSSLSGEETILDQDLESKQSQAIQQ